MLGKFFGAKKPKPSLNRHAMAASTENRQFSSALKIIHAGGAVEHYYMATPAGRIMEKYPSFILARPEVFRRPWESIVKRDEILVPGQKYFVVPKQTVKKLRRKIKRNYGVINNNNPFVLKSSSDVSVAKSATIKTYKAKNRRVRFFGIDTNKKGESYDESSYSASSELCIKEKSGLKSQPLTEERRRRHAAATWEPSLTMISETFGHDD